MKHEEFRLKDEAVALAVEKLRQGYWTQIRRVVLRASRGGGAGYTVEWTPGHP